MDHLHLRAPHQVPLLDNYFHYHRPLFQAFLQSKAAYQFFDGKNIALHSIQQLQVLDDHQCLRAYNHQCNNNDMTFLRIFEALVFKRHPNIHCGTVRSRFLNA